MQDTIWLLFSKDVQIFPGEPGGKTVLYFGGKFYHNVPPEHLAAIGDAAVELEPCGRCHGLISPEDMVVSAAEEQIEKQGPDGPYMSTRVVVRQAPHSCRKGKR